MVQEAKNLAVNDILKDVSKFYQTPAEVAVDKKFNREQKLEILENWELDQKRLLASEAENMSEDVETESAAKMLQDIQRVKDEL